MSLTQADLQVLWNAWFAYAPPDAQVALDAAKLRGEDWALQAWPPYIKWWQALDLHQYRSSYGVYKIARPINPIEAEFYAQATPAIDFGYLNWKDAILGKTPK